MSQASMSSFDEEHVRSLSASLGEPSWLLHARLAAFKQFAELPLEKSPLYSKYATAFSFPLEGFKAALGGSEIDFRSFFGGFLSGKEKDILLQGNETVVHSELGEDLRKKGVDLMPLHQALKEDEPNVRRLFERRMVKSEGDKFAAFVNAFFNGGTFVRVPSGVVLDRPLRRMLVLDSPGTSVIDQTFVVAEEQSRLVYLEEIYSKGSPTKAFVASTAEISARPDSHVDFSSIQLLNDQTTHVSNRGADVSTDARATVSSLSLGAAFERSRTNFYLNGRGSFAEGFEIFFTDGKQKYA